MVINSKPIYFKMCIKLPDFVCFLSCCTLLSIRVPQFGNHRWSKSDLTWVFPLCADTNSQCETWKHSAITSSRSFWSRWDRRYKTTQGSKDIRFGSFYEAAPCRSNPHETQQVILMKQKTQYGTNESIFTLLFTVYSSALEPVWRATWSTGRRWGAGKRTLVHVL